MKKILLSLTCACAVLLANAQSPEFQWAGAMLGTSNIYAKAVGTDTFGNVYTVGYFTGSGDFDPGTAYYPLTAKGSPIKTDFFIQKLDAMGSLVWAVGIGDTGTDVANSVAVDPAGNVYVTGDFSGTVDFDPGAGTYNLTSAGDVDAFVLKLDADGHFVWARGIGDGFADIGNAITVDDGGNVYTAGRFSGSVDFDPGTGTYPLTAVGNSDIFILKLDAAGNFLWAQGMGSMLDDAANGIAVDKAGNVYTTGFFYNTVDFDPGAGVHNLVSAGTSDIFVLKLNNAGNYVWAGNMGGTSDDMGNAIGVDASGDVYTTGYFTGTADFDPSPAMAPLHSAGVNDIFISKLDAFGNYQWAKSIGGTSGDVGYGLKLDAAGNVYTAGYFSGVVDFDPGPATTYMNSLAYGACIVQLDALGNFGWAKAMIGPTTHDNAVALGMDVDKHANVYTTGQFNGTIDFDPGMGIINLVAIGGGSGSFVQKLNHCSPFSASKITDTGCNQYVLGSSIYTTSGTYLKILTNAAGCDSFVRLTLTINNLNDTVTVSGDTLKANATGATYQWVRCPGNVVIPGATAQTYIALTTGSYAVQVSDGKCTVTSACHTVTGLGIDEHSAALPLQIIPNPTRGNISINTGMAINDWSVQVLSLTGATVLEKTHLSGTGCTLDLGNQPAGVYFVKVLSGSQAFAVQKIVKE